MGLRVIISGFTGLPEASIAPAPGSSPKQPNSAWRRVALKYDVCRMSATDLRLLAEELYAAGAIGFPDYRLLCLHPDTQHSGWPGWSTFQTPGERDGRRDWIGEIEARIASGHGDSVYIAYQKRLLSFLKRIERARLELQPAPAAPFASGVRPAAETRNAAGNCAQAGPPQPCPSEAT